jgi:hypothetical protein
MRNAAFRVLKIMMGILILPVILSFLLGVIFYLNQTIDNFILSRAGIILGIGRFTLASLPAGNALLILFFVMVALKGFFFHLLWKNKGKILQLLSDNKLDDQMMNQPKQVLDDTKEKVKEKTREVGEKAVGIGKVALGASIGHPGLMADGIVQTTSAPRHSRHSMKNILDEHFIGDNNKLDIKGGFSSLKERATGGSQNALYSSKEFEEYSQTENSGIQEVKVTNPDELKNDEVQQINNHQDTQHKDNVIIENPELEIKQEQHSNRDNLENPSQESLKTEPKRTTEETIVQREERAHHKEDGNIPKEEFISQEIIQVQQKQDWKANQESFILTNEQSNNKGMPQKEMDAFLHELRIERDK